MTTIAVTSTDVAWDSLQTFGDERNISPTEKVRVLKDARGSLKIIGVSGDSEHTDALMLWALAGASIEARPGGLEIEYEVLVIDKNGFTLFSHSNHGVKVSAPFCIGNGGLLARGAIALGEVEKRPVSALNAVKAAAIVDINTGGEIKSLNIKDALKRKRKKT